MNTDDDEFEVTVIVPPDFTFTPEELAWCDALEEQVKRIRKRAAWRPDVRAVLGETATALWLRGDYAKLTIEQENALLPLCRDLLPKDEQT